MSSIYIQQAVQEIDSLADNWISSTSWEGINVNKLGSAVCIILLSPINCSIHKENEKTHFDEIKETPRDYCIIVEGHVIRYNGRGNSHTGQVR